MLFLSYVPGLSRGDDGLDVAEERMDHGFKVRCTDPKGGQHGASAQVTLRHVSKDVVPRETARQQAEVQAQQQQQQEELARRQAAMEEQQLSLIHI